MPRKPTFELPLREFCERYTSAKASALLGCCKSAISLSLSSGREIYVVYDEDLAHATAYEICSFPRRGAVAESRRSQKAA